MISDSERLWPWRQNISNIKEGPGQRGEERTEPRRALQCSGGACASESRALMHHLILVCRGLDSGSGSSQAGCWWKLFVKQLSVSGEAIKLGKQLGEMAKETCEEEFLLVVSKASSPQAKMKRVLSQKPRKYLQTRDYVQMGPSWQPDPRGKSSEICNFSSQGSHFAKPASLKTGSETGLNACS